MGIWYSDVMDDIKSQSNYLTTVVDDGQLPDDIWLRLLVEGVGDVANAMSDNGVEDELVMVAAVSVAWLENIRSR